MHYHFLVQEDLNGTIFSTKEVPMDDKKLTKLFAAMMVVGGLMLLYVQKDRLLKKESPQGIQVDLSSSKQEIPKVEKTVVVKKEPVQKIEVEKVEEKKDEEDVSLEKKLIKESEEVKEKYINLIKAKLALPTDLQFIDIDLDEDGKAIYGYDHKRGLGLTVMALPKDLEKDVVLPFLDESQSYLPNTANNPVKAMGAPKALPIVNKNANVKEATIWSGALQDGKDIHVVMLRREDNKGTYFFLYTGPKDYFESNDGYFDKTYTEFEALPAQEAK